MFNIIKKLTFLIVLALVLSSTAAFGGNDESGDRRSHLQKRIYSVSVRTSIQIHDSVWEYYDQYKLKSPQKAIYIAVDDPYTYEGWAGGHGASYDTLSEAKAKALDECNGSRSDWNISEPCILFAENDNFVYGQIPAENLSSPSSSLPQDFMDWYYDEYVPAAVQKAIYIAHSAEGGWAGGMGFEHSTLSNAKAAALTQCNGSRSDWGISEPCVLFAENNHIVYSETQAATSCPLPTLSLSTFGIFIPAIQIDGYPNLWVDLKYSHEVNGTVYWQLNGAGVAQATASCSLPTLSLSTFGIFIPAIQIDGYPNLWVDLKYSHETNGIVYWQLNGAGIK